MAALVLIENESGSLTRFETGGERVRKTHGCTIGSYVDFIPAMIENFRVSPPDKFAVLRLCDPPKVA